MRRFLVLLPLLFPLQASAADKKKEPTPFERHAAIFLMKCAKCHTVGAGDRVGPDLKGVTKRRDGEWLRGFIARPSAYLDSDPEAARLLEKYNGVRMDDLGLSPDEVDGLIEYLEAASDGLLGPAPPEPLEEEVWYGKLSTPDEGLSPSVPGLLLLVLLLAGAGVLWQFEMRRAASLLLVLAAGTAYWSFGGRRYHHIMGNQQGFAPVQPIAFAHRLHAGELGIHCLYCHHGAEKSDVAGVPSASICMNCHRALHKRGKETGPSPEIAKLIHAWESRATTNPKPIEWVRVHNLPDYVHFSHRSHVANNIRCQECHGPVQTMEVMRQASPLSMGWCVNCHRQGVGEAPTHWKRSVGPLDCAACHW